MTDEILTIFIKFQGKAVDIIQKTMIYYWHTLFSEGFMVNLVQDLKSASYVQEHTIEILNYVENSRTPVVITQDGEAKAVIIDIESYQKTINAIHLAKLLSFGENDIKTGNLISHEDAKKAFEQTLAGKNQ